MDVLLLPTLGPLHMLHPRYNAVTLVELTRAFRPDAVWLASYSAEGLAEGVWRDDEELGLFFLLPWAERTEVPVVGVGENAEALKGESERFRRYLEEFEQGQAYLREEAEWRAPLEAVLAAPRQPEDWARDEVLSPLTAYLEKVAERFGEGPATGFREERMRGVAQKIASADLDRLVVWVDLTDYPLLLARVPGAVPPGAHQPTEAERQRAILDRAWQLSESDDFALLLSQLREIASPEAGYLASQIYLAAGQVEDALTLLEEVVAGDFHEPAYLPGYALARLGQLRDLVGDRDGALRAYRGVLALGWVPREAREIAQAGLRSPFRPAAR